MQTKLYSFVGTLMLAIFAVIPMQAQATAAPTPGDATTTNPDWSLRLVDSTLTRSPDPKQFGSWSYPRGLYLFGQYLVYRRTGDARYLKYIQDWVDSHIDAEGHLDREIRALDDVLAANLIVVLYQETHESRYKLAADLFRHRFDAYPRTSDGGFWHASVPSRKQQLWLDGNYMALQFLLRYGQVLNDAQYTNQEAVHQLLVYHQHLKAEHSGLLYHAYDASGESTWADPKTHHSAFFWCRAMGWYGMTLVDTLEVLPKNQPGRGELIRILRKLVASLAQYQDPETGLWYQIVDQPTTPGNWKETSSSSMFTYIIDVAVKRGYVSRKYHAAAEKGYRGVVGRISLGADGLTNLPDICEGTNVGNLQFYLDRKRNTNDLHGLGAFLLMSEEWNTSVTSQKVTLSKGK